MSEFTAADRRWMRRAMTLARRGWGRTSPNPMVGAVIVRNDELVGEGWHVEYGAAHAEMAALARASIHARGATLYVTLEPCNHVGRTPACAPALVDSGLARVVIGANDPNPIAKGGADTLRRGGVVVDAGLYADEAVEMNAAFHSRFIRERPFVTLKLAVSLDGGIANPTTGVSRLTGKAAERIVHQMRASHDAIAVGSGTAIADDPQLTVRGVRRPRIEPTRIVFDRRGRLPATGKLVRTAKKQPTLVVTEPGAGEGLSRLESRFLNRPLSRGRSDRSESGASIRSCSKVAQRSQGPCSQGDWLIASLSFRRRPCWDRERSVLSHFRPVTRPSPSHDGELSNRHASRMT